MRNKTIKPIEFDRKKNNSEIELVSRIIDTFENVLEKHSIYIPDEGRIGDEDEACIYGETYYELENKILKILRDNQEVLYENNDKIGDETRYT